MYQVEVKHFRPAYRKGDLEEEMALVGAPLFKTRKAAKEYIESRARKFSNVRRSYHTGDEPSFVYCFTGETWVNENSGERNHEYYQYKMFKAKVK